MRLRYTPDALAELDEILTEIKAQSARGARRVHERIRSILELLVDYPWSGQRTSHQQMRRIAATPFPYLIFYEVVEDEVIILGIRHGARDPSSMPAQS